MTKQGSRVKRRIASRTAASDPTVTTGTTNTPGQVAFWDGSSSITGDFNLFWDNTNKRLGVGTASPAEVVHIKVISGNQGMRFENLGNTASDFLVMRFFQGGVEQAVIFTNQGKLFLRSDSSTPTTVLADAGGNVGVGTTNPQGKLHVAGGNTIIGGDLLPDTDNTRNCGTPTTRWALVRAQNVICGDIGFEEATCFIDGEPFQPGDKIVLAIKEVNELGIRCAPVHANHQAPHE